MLLQSQTVFGCVSGFIVVLYTTAYFCVNVIDVTATDRLIGA